MKTEIPKNKDGSINWIVHEYLGGTVECVPPGLSLEEARDLGNWPADFIPRPITGELKVGQVVLVWGHSFWTVSLDNNGGLCLRGKTSMGFLEYKQDDRQCWVCGGVVSDSALEKIRSLELTR